MAGFLNPLRPPAFCPGCSHERSLHAMDKALDQMGLAPQDVVIVSDIGCSGLFDTFYNTHALHGLHGRALTYATGIKLARPNLKVIVTMGDGGLGIGGAHFLAACRRNLDLTLLILNNFSFAMTGGQFSCTTPPEAAVASGFLNTLEKPMDVCSVAAAAGAAFVARCAVHRPELVQVLVDALLYEGFSLVDMWGICPARYRKSNPITTSSLDEALSTLPPYQGSVPSNARREYSAHYREKSSACSSAHDRKNTTKHKKGLPGSETVSVLGSSLCRRREVVLLGSAGERVITAGEVLARAAIAGGMYVTQKNDHNITVMRGPSVAELILSQDPILYTGVEHPDILLVLSSEGVARRRDLFAEMNSHGRVILSKGVEIPSTQAVVHEIDFQTQGIRRKERALAALFLLSFSNDPITPAMLRHSVGGVFEGKNLEAALDLMNRSRELWKSSKVGPQKEP